MDIQVILSVAFTLLSTQAKNCLEEQQCSTCSRITEYCTTDCFPGYFGLKCKSLCSKHCKNSTCERTQNGIHKCSEGCIPGFHGSKCNIPCTSPKGSCTKCPQECDGNYCHLQSSCVSGCHDSYYGSNCETCSRRCRSCNRITGRCDMCHEPYSGDNCQFSCEHCSITNCVHKCAPGLYGQTCSKTCSKNCLAYSTADTKNTVTSNSFISCTSECQRDSGECINGCFDGGSGPNCSSQVQCNSNCMGCNETGACIEGCLPGYYGDFCEPCPGTCFNHICHPKNGSCDNGCIYGQYGQFCKLSCLNCSGGDCHPPVGICSEDVRDKKDFITWTSTAAVLFVVGIIVTGCIFQCKRISANRKEVTRRQSDTNRQGGSSRRFRMSEHIYNEVNEDEMGPVIVFL